MGSRSFFVKMNLDDVGHAIIEYDDAESLGYWFKGYLVGAHGKPLRADALEPYRAGHAYGLIAFNETEQFRAKQADLANKRWHPDAKPVPPHDAGISHGPIPDACHGISQDACQTNGIEHRASSIQHREAKNEQPQAAMPSGIPFIEFWSVYPRKDAKKKASEKWATMTDADRKAAIDGIPGMKARASAPRFIPHPTTYLNQERWNDQGIDQTQVADVGSADGYSAAEDAGYIPNAPVDESLMADCRAWHAENARLKSLGLPPQDVSSYPC
jgi:hypothetical protein